MSSVQIKGMTCQHCVASTKEALEKISGIEEVEVDLDKGEARYSGDVDQKEVKEAIESIGFEVI